MSPSRTLPRYTIATIRDGGHQIVARVEFRKADLAVEVVLAEEADRSVWQSVADSVNRVLQEGTISTTPFRSIQISKDQRRQHLSKVVSISSNGKLELTYDDDATHEARLDEMDFYRREHIDEPTSTTAELLAKLDSLKADQKSSSGNTP